MIRSYRSESHWQPKLSYSSIRSDSQVIVSVTFSVRLRNKYEHKTKFFCKKFTSKDTKLLPKFDHILLLGVLHHLSDKEINKLIPNIKKVLKRKGNIITLDNIFTNNQNFIAKFLIQMDKGQNVRSKKGYLNILKNHFKKINSKIYHQKFIPYTWFVAICTN